MTILYINTGTGPNAGDGDSLRTAFNKVNTNFRDIDGRYDKSVTLTQSEVPPFPGSTSTIWFDTVGGRAYVFYDGQWIDANPTVDYQLPAATTSTLGGVVIGSGFNISPEGIISINQGTQGFQGYQGFQGAQGFQGNTGAQGAQGVQGVQGAQGFQGDVGFQGFQGNTGVQGSQGFQGVQGAQGFQGFQGDVGFQGFQGDAGFQGFQGFQGNNGAQGPSGTANLPADAPGFLYDDGAGTFSWTQPSILSSGTFNLALTSDGVLRLNNNVFSPGTGSTSTLVNTVSTSTLKIVAPPTTLIGALYDVPGNVAFDANFIYYCTGTYGVIYSAYPIQAGTNTNRIYVRQSALPVAPQPGWIFQDALGGPVYTVTQVFSGIFFSPPPTVAYYQLNISSSILTYTTQTNYLIGQTSSNKIWNTTPWDALTYDSLNTSNSGYNASQQTPVSEKNIKVRYSGNGDLELSTIVEGISISYTGYYQNQLTITAVSSATTLSTSTWLPVNAAMASVGDSMELKLQDGTHIYRITGMVTPTVNNGSVVIETLI